MTIENETTLPSGYTARRPVHDDIPAILSLMTACDLDEAGAADEMDAADIEDEWKRSDPAQNAYILLAMDGTMAACATAIPQGQTRVNLDVYVHPEHRGRGLGTWLTRALEARAGELLADAPADARLTAHTGINSPNALAVELLHNEGYAPVRHFWRMRIEILTPPPAPTWPEGVAVRSCIPGQDERIIFNTLEEAFADHWGHVPRDYESWAEVNVASETYDPSLWLLATAGEEPAGAVRGRMRSEEGWINTLGVRRPWRRSGLGMAMLLHMFGVFYARGVRVVGLGVDAQNPTGATRLYERAGMRVDRQYAVLEKELRPGVESEDLRR